MHECDFLILLNQEEIHYDFDCGSIYNSEKGIVVVDWTVTDYDQVSSLYIRENCPPNIAKFVRTIALINGITLEDSSSWVNPKLEEPVCTSSNSLKP